MRSLPLGAQIVHFIYYFVRQLVSHNPMVKNSVLLASFLALTLAASVFSNAYALSVSGEEKKISSPYDQDQNNGKKEKAGGNNNSGKGSSGKEDDDKEKESKKNKGNKIKVKSNKGGRGQVSEVASNETTKQQALSSSEDEYSQSLLFPADFSIKAQDGIAIERGRGNSIASSAMDAAINLNTTTVRLEGNHVRVAVYGMISLDDEQVSLEDGKGIIIFFSDSGSKLFRGIIHLTGKVMLDENNGAKSQKFHLRAFLLPPNGSSSDESQWAFVVKPAAKVGPKIRISQLAGELIQLDGDSTLPPAANKKLDRFSVVIPGSSSIVSGVQFNVTVTALDSDGNVLRSYNGNANVTDLTGKVKPSIASNFVNGVFSGKLNITKAMKSDKLTFTDVATGKSGTSAAFDVLAGPPAKLELSPPAATVQPGSKASFAAKVLDKFGNEISPSGSQFGWSLSSANFGSIETGGNTANFTASSSVTSETNVTLTAAAGALQDSSKITIKPQAAPALDHFVITTISSPKVAGSPFAISITAVTLAGATVTTYTGPIELDDTTGTLTVKTDNGFSSGVWTGSVNITKASSSVKITVQDASSSAKNGTSNAFEVAAGSLDHFEVSEIANQTTAGAEIEFAVTAEDAYGNAVKNFNGTVALSTNVHTSEISPNPYAFNPATDLGSHTFKAKLYNATEDAKITVASSGKSGSSNNFDVVAGAVDQVNVTPSDVSVPPGQNATFAAEARDAFGNVVEGITFNWSLSSSGLGTLGATTETDVLFTANAGATETLDGALTATHGTKSGAATIQVVV